MLSGMHSMMVNRPREEVFAFLANPNKFAEWEEGVISAKVDGEVKEGAKGHMVRRLMRRIEVDFEITKYAPPTSASFRTTSGPMRMEGIFEFEAHGERQTQVTVRYRGRAHGIMILVQPFLQPVLNRTWDRSLQRAKSVLESSTAQSR